MEQANNAAGTIRGWRLNAYCKIYHAVWDAPGNPI